MSSFPPSSYHGNPEMAKALGMKIPGPSAVDMQEFRGVDLQQPPRYQDILKTGEWYLFAKVDCDAFVLGCFLILVFLLLDVEATSF